MDTGLSNKLIILGLLLIYIGYLDNQMNKRPEVYTYHGEAGIYTVYTETGQVKTPNNEIVDFTRNASVSYLFYTLSFPDGRSYSMNSKHPEKISSMMAIYTAGGENLDLWFSLIEGEPDYQYIDGDLVNVNPSTPGLIYMQLPFLIFGALFIFLPGESLGEFCSVFNYSNRDFYSSSLFCTATRLLGVYLFLVATFRLMAG